MTRVSKSLKKLLLYILVVSTVIVFCFPLFAAFLASFKPDSEILSTTPHLFPRVFTLDHYIFILTYVSLATDFENSFLVAFTVTVFTLLISGYSAYFLTRFRASGTSFISKLLFLFYMAPDIAIGIGFYLLFSRTGLLDTYISLCIAHSCVTIPLSIWLLWGYFRGIPLQLDEAAMVDGAGRIQTLRHIVLPLALPGVSAAGIFAFVLSWNEYTLSSILMLSREHTTLPVALSLIQLEGAFWGETMAMSVLATIPALIFISFAMKYLVKGLTAGAMKY